MTRWVWGFELSPEVQRQAKAQFVHRFTADHVPSWVAKSKRQFPHFASDADWLTHTRFAVTKAGELSRSVHYCDGQPTWPKGVPPDAHA